MRNQVTDKPYIEIYEHWCRIDETKDNYGEAVKDFQTEKNIPHTDIKVDKEGIHDNFNSYNILLRHSNYSKNMWIKVFSHGNNANTMTLSTGCRNIYCCKNFKTQQNVCNEIKNIIEEFEKAM